MTVLATIAVFVATLQMTMVNAFSPPIHSQRKGSTSKTQIFLEGATTLIRSTEERQLKSMQNHSHSLPFFFKNCLTLTTILVFFGIAICGILNAKQRLGRRYDRQRTLPPGAQKGI